MTEQRAAIYKLIHDVFDDRENQIEIIDKLRPYFSLKVIPGRDIEKVYSSLEKIDAEKIDLLEEFKYEEEKFDSTNKFETTTKSIGLSNFDLELSVSIFSHKQSIGGGVKMDKLDESSKKSSKIYCIHSIFISLFRIVVDYKDIKLSRQVNEELKEIDNSNVTEKKLLLEKFVEKFGLYIPLEVLVGGRINMSFEANSEEEKKNFHDILEKKIGGQINVDFKGVSGNLNASYKDSKQESSSNESLSKIENLSIKMIGGDYLCKDDLMKWIKSFNFDNLQIIEYKTLIPIYCFLPGFEKKMKICLQNYEDIVLKEIKNLINLKFKIQENQIYEGSSKKSNFWKIGILKDNYKSFIIYQKIINKKIIIKKDEVKFNKKIKDTVICGLLPENFIICGWSIKINANSMPDYVSYKWERRKDLNLIGNNCFRYKLKINIEENKNLESDIEIDWILKLFCINYEYLMPYTSEFNFYKQNKGHYFLNCDCYKRVDEKSYLFNCYYSKYDIKTKK